MSSYVVRTHRVWVLYRSTLTAEAEEFSKSNEAVKAAGHRPMVKMMVCYILNRTVRPRKQWNLMLKQMGMMIVAGEMLVQDQTRPSRAGLD